IDGDDRNREVRQRAGVNTLTDEHVPFPVERRDVRIEDEEAHSASGSSSSWRRYSSIACFQASSIGSSRSDPAYFEKGCGPGGTSTGTISAPVVIRSLTR